MAADEPIGSVRVDVVADYSKLSQSFQAAQSEAAKSGSAIASAFSGAVSPTTSLTEATNRLKAAQSALASEGAKMLAQVQASAPGYASAQAELAKLNAEVQAAKTALAEVTAAGQGAATANEAVTTSASAAAAAQQNFAASTTAAAAALNAQRAAVAASVTSYMAGSVSAKEAGLAGFSAAGGTSAYAASLRAAVPAAQSVASTSAAMAAAFAQQRTAQTATTGGIMAGAAAAIQAAQATETHAKALSHGVTELQATSAGIRTLEGNGGLRAVENFLAKTLGLGPAMRAIFPIVGAIAFAEILGHIGQELYDLFRNAIHGPERLRGEFNDLNSSLKITSDELQVANDKTANEIAKLSGNIPNNVKLVVDEITLSVDKLGNSLDKALDSLTKLLKQEAVGFFAGLITNTAMTDSFGKVLGGETGLGGKRAEIAKIIRETDAQIEAARKLGNTQAAVDEANRARADARNRIEAVYNKLIDDRKAKLQSLKEAPEAFQGMGEAPVPLASESANKEIVGATAENLQQQKDMLMKLYEAQTLEQKKVGMEAGRSRAQEQYKQWEDELANMKARDTVTLSEERAFWAEKLAIAQAGGVAYRDIVRSIDTRVGQLHQEAIRRSIAEGNKSEAETLHQIQQQMKQAEEDAAEAGGHPAATKLNLLKDLTSSDTGLSAANYQKLFDQIPEAQRAADKEATADLKKMLAEQDQAWQESGIRTAKEVRERAEVTRAALEDLRPFFVGIDALIDSETAKIVSANKRIEAEKLRVADLVARNQEAGGEAEIQQRRIALESAYGLQSVHTYQQQIAYQQQLAALEAESLQLKLAKADADYRAAVASRDEVRIQQALNEQAAAGAAIDLQRQQSEAELAKLKKEQSIGGQISVGLNQDAESAVSRISSGIATLTTQTRGWGQEFKAVLRDIERSIVQTLAHAALRAGLNKLLEFGQSKFGGGGGGGVLGTTVGAAGGAAATISKTVSGAANTAAQSANTAALTADTTALVANTAASTALAATMATEIAAQTVTDSLMAGMIFALSANTAALIATTVALYVNAATNIFGFAAGGDPPVGIPSLVGEQGPELFIPKSAGTIIPADRTRAMLADMQQSFAGFRVPAGALTVPNVPASAFLSTAQSNGISGAAGGAVTNQNTGRIGDTHYNIYGANNPREVMRQIADFEKRQTGRYSPANS